MSFDEQARLYSLQSYDILDSVTEREYEEITLLASLICNTPIALISLVDKDRQWFKSHFGLAASETPREYSFCAHSLDNPHQPFIVEDASADSRFSENPLVTGDPRIAFYAGIPLVDPDGFALGTMCVIDTVTRTLSDAQIDGLKILSNQVMTLLSHRKLARELREVNQLLSDENFVYQAELMLAKHSAAGEVNDSIRELLERNARLESELRALKSDA